jgi:uncharacterized cupredoxin-like copper-binding protein
MRIGRVAVGLALTALVACGSGGEPGRTTSRTQRIVLSHLRFAPDTLTVRSGTTVRFVLANSDTVDHEFVLGSDDVQQEHERMRMAGGHMMRGPGMTDVPPGKTVQLTYTFSEPGTLIYGCHVDDHYAQGMKGTVTVTA